MKVVVGTFLTLDGVMQAPGGPDEDRSGGFEHGGWMVPYFDAMMLDLSAQWTRQADGVLLGRKTYEIFAAHWPHVTGDDPFAAKLNAVPKYVASRTLKRVDWNNSTLIRGELADTVARLKRQPGNELQVTGSGDLIQTLLAHNLVDEYRLWIAPVLLGEGKRLFEEGTVPAGLALRKTRTSTTGVVIQEYQVVGAPSYGSFALQDPPPEELERREKVVGGSRER